ncbi:solute carrier family 23 member 3 isoform X2 [Xenopus laevis]|nr:solute carrier family 23 member 3 isoform X2 [Xenopus laevis]
MVQASLLCTCHYFLLQVRPLAPQEQSRLLANSLFACGIATSLQSSLGTRLPLVQAPTFELLIPALILNKHPPENETSKNDTQGSLFCKGNGCEKLQRGIQPVREVSGALVISGGLQAFFGVSGLCGWILQNCGPVILASTLSIIGLSCYKPAALFCSTNWAISLLLISLTAFLSQTLRSCHLPVCTWKRKEGVIKKYVPIFRMLSIFMPVTCIIIASKILEHIGELPAFPVAVRLEHNGSMLAEDGTQDSYFNLGENKTQLSPWFQVPSIGAWGWPEFSLQTLSVGIAMALTSTISSMGCYVLCARILCCPTIPHHASNRGISIEGVGNVLSGLLGSVCGAGSSIPNAGLVGHTQVGSRHSVQFSALLFVVLGCSPKLCEFLMSIPFAVHGGVFCLTYSMAVGAGVSYFLYTDIDSGRNIFIVGFAVFMALLVPRRLEADPGQLATGWLILDLFLLSILTVPTFLGGLLSFVLENTITGTLLERGLHSGFKLWVPATGEDTPKARQEELAKTYSLPSALTRHLPTVYPFSQLFPPPYVSLEGSGEVEAEKLLTAKPSIKDPELG